jgi:hypothetical protein
MAVTHTEFGKFAAHYRALERADLLKSTPLILSEGDSWFSMPLYFNIVDWLEARAPDAMFMRLEKTGDLALDMFSGGSLRSITQRVKSFEFDVLLLSGGGNDFVDRFLRDTFKRAQPMSVADAIAKVRDTGRFGDVLKAYIRVLDSVLRTHPALRVIVHSYDYPQSMGKAAKLTVETIGLVGLFKRSVGDWIARHIRHTLPKEADQLAFARGLIDQFFLDVLKPLTEQYKNALDVIDVRKTLTSASDWNDEMHPTAAGYKQIAEQFVAPIQRALPAAKRAAFV